MTRAPCARAQRPEERGTLGSRNPARNRWNGGRKNGNRERGEGGGGGGKEGGSETRINRKPNNIKRHKRGAVAGKEERGKERKKEMKEKMAGHGVGSRKMGKGKF